MIWDFIELPKSAITSISEPRAKCQQKEGKEKEFPNGISECGADALRFSLIAYTTQSDKIKLDILRVVGYRTFCNKLWNAVRFAMSKLGEKYSPPRPENLDPTIMPFSCQWILSRLNKVISETISSLESYKFSDAASAVHSWWLYDLCDVYIEAIKPYFASCDEAKYASKRGFAQDTLWVCLDYGLRLLHPFMPYVREELWQRLPSPKDFKRKESIMICDYPSVVENWTCERAEWEMKIVDSVVKSLRSFEERRERKEAFVICRTNGDAEVVTRRELEISTLANLSSLKVLPELSEKLMVSFDGEDDLRKKMEDDKRRQDN